MTEEPEKLEQGLTHIGWWRSWGGDEGRFYYKSDTEPFVADLLPVFIPTVSPNGSLRRQV